MSDEHVDDLIDLYALGALEPGEQNVVDSHLETCMHCQALLAERQRLVALLAWTPDQRTPPPDLGPRIRRHIEHLQHQEGGEILAQRPQLRLPPRRLRVPSLRAGLVVAGLALLLLLGGWNVALQRRLASLSTQLAEQQAAARVLLAPEARRVIMAAQPAAPRARGSLYLDPAGSEAYLVADGLQPLPNDKAYQLWLVEGEQRTSGGVFRADERGAATLLIHSPRPLRSYTSCGITIERAGGSDRPTGDRVLRSEFGSAEEW